MINFNMNNQNSGIESQEDWEQSENNKGEKNKKL